MACEVKQLGSATVIICSRGRRRPKCRWCDRPGTQLCDYPLTGEKAGKTCDAPCCSGHAKRVGPDRDHCPAHHG